MVEQDLAELRSSLAAAQELLAEVRHQRDALERQLVAAEWAQRELRQLLLGRQQILAEGGAPVTQAGSAPDGEPAPAALAPPLLPLREQRPGDEGIAGDSLREPREPTLREWWRDIDRMRRLGASLILSAIVSFVFAIGFHFLLTAHLIDNVFRLGYIFALIGILLFIAGAGMLF